MLKEEIISLIRSALATLKIESDNIQLEHPSNLSFGDYSTNIALHLAKKLKKSPMEVAKEIKTAIPSSKNIAKINIVNPGFINFYLAPQLLIKEIQNQINLDFKINKKEKQTILFEFGDPNTHKFPHIGHLFSYIYGESLARIMELCNNKVIRVSYQGDIGLHVAKALWSYLKIKPITPKNIIDKIKLLQECYQDGAKKYEDDEVVKKEIDELNNKIYKNDPSVMDKYELTRSWSLELYKQLETQLRIKYQRHYFESEVFESGKELVQKNIPAVFEESNGAIIFDGEKYGLHKRVFINKYGNSTYEAKDMGLIQLKKDEYKFDISLVTTAHEQSEYWKVIIKASELLFPDLKGKLKHLGFGMINLTTGKMASRTGQIINAVSLISDVTESLKSTFNITNKVVVKKIAFAALKYSLLKSNAFANITFDIEKSISKNGDSGPYLLYTYVRCLSILKNQTLNTEFNISKLRSEEEENLLQLLYLLPETAKKAYSSYSPHFIATYLFDLAQKFNLFYQKHNILQSDKETKKIRLFLTKTTSEVIKNGLYLLGIETVEKM